MITTILFDLDNTLLGNDMDDISAPLFRLVGPLYAEDLSNQGSYAAGDPGCQ